MAHFAPGFGAGFAVIINLGHGVLGILAHIINFIAYNIDHLRVGVYGAVAHAHAGGNAYILFKLAGVAGSHAPMIAVMRARGAFINQNFTINRPKKLHTNNAPEIHFIP